MCLALGYVRSSAFTSSEASTLLLTIRVEGACPCAFGAARGMCARRGRSGSRALAVTAATDQADLDARREAVRQHRLRALPLCRQLRLRQPGARRPEEE